MVSILKKKRAIFFEQRFPLPPPSNPESNPLSQQCCYWAICAPAAILRCGSRFLSLPSPESNPNSPLPVTATVVHYTTVKS